MLSGLLTLLGVLVGFLLGRWHASWLRRRQLDQVQTTPLPGWWYRSESPFAQAMQTPVSKPVDPQIDALNLVSDVLTDLVVLAVASDGESESEAVKSGEGGDFGGGGASDSF